MATVGAYAPGTFCWIDLGTTDAEAAKQFYAELFGWTMVDVPAGPDMTYTMIQMDGQNVGGLYGLSVERVGEQVPPHWLSYVSVDDVTATAEGVSQHGGRVLDGPMEVMSAGKRAGVEDPTGAAFALWQPLEHHGADHVNAPGGLCWNELATRDVERAGQFYAQLFGWRAEELASTMGPYTVFNNGDRPAGGMMGMTEAWPDSIPAHWMIYFAVEDCDASAKLAVGLGGQQLVEPTDIPDVGRFAVIQDPQGAVFSIMKMAMPA